MVLKRDLFFIRSRDLGSTEKEGRLMKAAVLRSTCGQGGEQEWSEE